MSVKAKPLIETKLFERLKNNPIALEAHRVQEALSATGVGCYVRCWHIGQHGWFVVSEADYTRLNFPQDVESMPAMSFGNRRIIEQAVRQDRACGCYACARTFLPTIVEEWSSDDTALCPHCGIDAVLVGVTDPAVLAKGMERWFAGRETTAR